MRASAFCRGAFVAALALPFLLLSGCLFSTRKLPVPRAPSIVQTVAPDVLVEQLNQRWAALNTVTATVEIQASVMKTKEGVAKDYTTVRGHILMRKPGMLRVLGQVLGARMFDAASDGKNFTLYIPLKSKVIKGSNALKKKSPNALENIRPGFFFDAMAVRGLETDDEYMVIADTETVEDVAKKHLYTVPEYILTVMRPKPGRKELKPIRVITFRRDDLMPYQQDLYDDNGNLETQVSYGPYKDFDSSRYPSTITIKRPLDEREEFRIVLTVEDVKENQKPPLTDDQFQIKIPEGTEIQVLE